MTEAADLQCDRVSSIADDLIEYLKEELPDPTEKMQALATVAVFILSHEMFGREEASNLLGHFSMAVVSGVKYADDTGNHMWVSGPGN